MASGAMSGLGLETLAGEVQRQAHARHPSHRTIAWRWQDEDRSIFARHKRLIQGLVVVGSAASVERLDAVQIRVERLGRSARGSWIALFLSAAATCIARKYRRRHGDVEDLLAATTAGLASGLVVRAIAKQAGGC